MRFHFLSSEVLKIAIVGNITAIQNLAFAEFYIPSCKHTSGDRAASIRVHEIVRRENSFPDGPLSLMKLTSYVNLHRRPGGT